MKKNIFFAALIAVVTMFCLVGCGKEAVAEETVPTVTVAAPTATTTLSPTSVPDQVTIDFDKSQLSNGELVVWTSAVGFHRAYGVVDFRIGDVTNVTGRWGEVVAMWISRYQGAQEAELWAAFVDGSVEKIASPGGYYDHRLPFGVVDSDTVLNGLREGYKITLAVRESTYYFRIVSPYHDYQYEVVDYLVAYDTVYWLVAEGGNELVAYYLNWEDPEAVPQVYYRGCNSLSHHADEAEGCLVPLDKANSHYYDRVDLYTPYPNGGGWSYDNY